MKCQSVYLLKYEAYGPCSYTTCSESAWWEVEWKEGQMDGFRELKKRKQNRCQKYLHLQSWSAQSSAVTKQTASDYIPVHYAGPGWGWEAPDSRGWFPRQSLTFFLLECKTQRRESSWLFSIAFFSFSGFLFISEFCVSIWFVVILKNKLRYLPYIGRTC